MSVKNLNTKGANIVIVYDSLDISAFDITKFNTKLFGSYETRALINQFPDITILTIPDKQIIISLENKRILIQDLRVSEFTARDSSTLLEITKMISSEIGKATITYGFNYSFEFEVEGVENSSDKLNSIFLGDNTRIDPLKTKFNSSNIIGSGYRLIFDYSDEHKMDYRFESELNDSTTSTKRFLLNVNSHYGKSLPDFEDLVTSFNTEYSKFNATLNGLFE